MGEPTTEISTTFESVNEYSRNLGRVDVKYGADIYEYMSQDIVNNTLEPQERFILPNSRDFTFDCTADPLPQGTIRLNYKKANGAPNVFVQWMYQHAAIAAKGDKSLSEVFGGASFVGFSGIFESLAKCLYDPGYLLTNGVNNTDFKMTATKIEGVIFMSWNKPSSVPVTPGVQKVNSYRFTPSVVSFGSVLKRKEIKILTIAKTDSYEVLAIPPMKTTRPGRPRVSPSVPTPLAQPMNFKSGPIYAYRVQHSILLRFMLKT